jgi:hypothetical protein
MKNLKVNWYAVVFIPTVILFVIGYWIAFDNDVYPTAKTVTPVTQEIAANK